MSTYRILNFCKQCSIELFAKDMKDLAGMITAERVADGQCAVGICEGCGGGEFDHEGNCFGGCMVPDHRSPHEPTVPK